MCNPKIVSARSDGKGDFVELAAGGSEENKAVVQGSIATFGTYSFAGTDLLIKVEHSTFPNWIGAD